MLASPITNQQSGQAAFPRKSIMSGMNDAASTIAKPPPVPNNIPIESALRLAFCLNKPEASAPAVENEIAPNNPAKKRNKYCISIVVKRPVNVKTTDVVVNPKANSFWEDIFRTMIIVRIAPRIYPKALMVLSQPAWL